VTSATIGNAVRDTARRLAEAGLADAPADARLLVGLATGLDRTGIITDRDRRLTPSESCELDTVVARRLHYEPVSRIVGQREFWSMTFQLGPDTLDPRPDSETLIEEALKLLPSTEQAYRFLDLGTGTGCLLLALLSERPHAWGIGTDLAEGAVMTARSNAQSLGLAGRSSFLVGHWGDALECRFDLVVCNPPYIRSDDRTLAPEVRNHDPSLALFAGTDGLDAYRELGPILGSLLAPAGRALLEIGAGQATDVVPILASSGLETTAICTDLARIDRVLVIQALNPSK